MILDRLRQIRSLCFGLQSRDDRQRRIPMKIEERSETLPSDSGPEFPQIQRRRLERERQNFLSR